MSKPKHHFFVCTNARPPFAGPSCGPEEGNEILMGLREEVEKRELQDDVQVTGCACLGPCENGPVVAVYPEAIWYNRVKSEDVEEIVKQHMVNGKPVERLIYDWPEAS